MIIFKFENFRTCLGGIEKMHRLKKEEKVNHGMEWSINKHKIYKWEKVSTQVSIAQADPSRYLLQGH